MFTSIPAVESAISTTAAIPESGIGSSNATTKGSTRYAAAVAAGVVLFGLLSPANAMARQDRISTLTEPSASAPAAHDINHPAVAVPDRNAAIALTSHLPWLAPVGHRQPRKVDVRQNEDLSARERRQQHVNEELDRKLIICRGC